VGYEISIKAAKDRLSELVRSAEKGDVVTITRNGRPVADLKIHQPRKGFDRAALEAWKRERGYFRLVGPAVEDFDRPLDEDILIKPLR
jgi:antitoxin (DNA-binding transcriptional repressor) of toxin-antitoxin stability system